MSGKKYAVFVWNFVSFHTSFDDRCKACSFDGLCDVVVHAGGQKPFAVAFYGICCNRNNRCWEFGSGFWCLIKIATDCNLLTSSGVLNDHSLLRCYKRFY